MTFDVETKNKHKKLFDLAAGQDKLAKAAARGLIEEAIIAEGYDLEGDEAYQDLFQITRDEFSKTLG